MSLEASNGKLTEADEFTGQMLGIAEKMFQELVGAYHRDGEQILSNKDSETVRPSTMGASNAESHKPTTQWDSKDDSTLWNTAWIRSSKIEARACAMLEIGQNRSMADVTKAYRKQVMLRRLG